MKRARTFCPADCSCCFSSTYVHHAFQAPTTCACSIRFSTLAHTTLNLFVSSVHSAHASKDSARWRFSNRCISRRAFFVSDTVPSHAAHDRASSPFIKRAITRFAAVFSFVCSST